MAEVEKAVFDVVTSDATVAALIGTALYANRVSENRALPYVVYERTSTERQHTLAGVSSLSKATIQMTSWADTYANAKAIGSAIRGALDGYAGVNVGITVRSAFMESEADTSAQLVPGEETGENGITQTFVVWFDDT